MGFIYKITSPNGKVYVGKTYNLKNRISDYRCKRHRSKKSIIISSIKLYGWESHKFEVIEVVIDSLMNDREIYWIDKLQTYAYSYANGMNLTRGGDGQRHSWKNDKERVDKARLRKGENSPTWGKVLSQDTKNKISKSVSDYNIKNRKVPLKQCYEALSKVISRPVICYDLNGNFAGEFNSVKLAAFKLNVDRKTLNDALNKRQKHGGGYIVKDKFEGYPLKIKVDKSKLCIKKRPILCVLNGEIMGEYKTLPELANNIGVKVNTVRDAFFSKRITRTGYYFVFKDEYKIAS